LLLLLLIDLTLALPKAEVVAKELQDGIDKHAVRVLNHLLPTMQGRSAKSTHAPLQLSQELAGAAIELYRGHLEQLHEDQEAGFLLYETELYQALAKLANELRACELEQLPPVQRGCFFLNIYTALLLHGVVLTSLDTSSRDAGKNRQAFAKSVAYDIGGLVLSLFDIEFSILRSPAAVPKKTGLFSRPKPPPRSPYAVEPSSAGLIPFIIPTLTECGAPLNVFKDLEQVKSVAGEYFQRVLVPDERRRAVLVPEELVLPLAEFGLSDFLKKCAMALKGPLSASLLSLSELNSRVDDLDIEWLLKVRIATTYENAAPPTATENLALTGELADDAPPPPAAADDQNLVPTSAAGGLGSGAGAASRLFSRKKAGAGAALGSSGAGSSGALGASGAGEAEKPADSVSTTDLTGRAQNVLGKASTEKPNLIMKHMQLTGVPAEVLAMTHIEVLDLRSNLIETLPDLIGRLVSLRTLRLANNQISELPLSMTQLKNLTELDIGQNDFGKFGLSPTIATLSTLRNLLMQWNNLESLPDSLGSMANLRWLDVSVNRMSDLPPTVSGLRLLEQLDLSHNSINEIPAAMLSLTSLVRLELIGNELETLPVAIAMLQALTRLDVRNNRLTSLPKSIAHISGLRQLLFERNALKKLPAELVQINAREALLSNNQLTKLPPFGAENSSLEELHAFKNALKDLPDDIGACQSLRQIDVSDNAIATLPASFGKLKNLHRLVVARNKLKELPDELGACAGLQELYLFHNRIKSLPKTFAHLERMQFLQLNNNRVGKLDEKTLRGMHGLQSLQLASNHLKALPALSVPLTALNDLNLFGNALTDVPDALQQLPALKTLNLGRNSLSQAKNWQVLEELDHVTSLCLDDNELLAIPEPVFAMKRLAHLSLSCNRISAVPKGAQALAQLGSFFISNNRLVALPSPMLSESKLKEANFAFNRITTVPQSIVNCTALLDLDLTGNRLTEEPDIVRKLLPNCDIKVLGNALEELDSPPKVGSKKKKAAPGSPDASETAGGGGGAGSDPSPLTARRSGAAAPAAKAGALFRSLVLKPGAGKDSGAGSEESDTVKDEMVVRVVLGDSMPRRGCNLTVGSKVELKDAIEQTNTKFGLVDAKRRKHFLVRSKDTQTYVANVADAGISLLAALSLLDAKLFEVVLADDAAAATVPTPEPAASAAAAGTASENSDGAASTAAASPAPSTDVSVAGDDAAASSDAEVLARLNADASGLTEDYGGLFRRRCVLDTALSVGWAEMQGRRPEQQDRLQVLRQLTGEGHDELYVGVFDGHTGHEVSSLCAEKLHTFLAEALEQSREDKGLKLKSEGSNGAHAVSPNAEFSKSELKQNRRIAAALRRAFEATHSEAERRELQDGAAVIVAFAVDRRLFIANAGDCRAVVFDAETKSVVWTTNDHKPDSPSEAARIKLTGGFVSDKCRVNGVLSLSRSIGDVSLQPAVTWEPEISLVALVPGVAYRVVLACDGLYDVCVSNDELPEAMGGIFLGQQDCVQGSWFAASAAARLREYAFAHDSRDNLSIVCIDVKK
jgi:leucine-rich repeat protein SHOC2